MKRVFGFAMTLAVAVALFTGCSCYNKMVDNTASVKISSSPEVLAYNNGVVAAEVTVTFPAEYINKKSVVKITPMMVFDGGEVEGTPFIYQGASVDDNYKTVGESGASFTESVEFDYVDGMNLGKLVAKIEMKCDGDDTYTLIDASTGKKAEAGAAAEQYGVYVADGVNTMQMDIKYCQFMLQTENNYQRVLTEVTKAELPYNISSSTVKSSSLKSDEVKAFTNLVGEQSGNERVEQKLFANGYASPDGPEKFNNKLSSERSQSAKNAVAKLIKEYGLDIDVASYGEDWEGFQNAVAASSIKDKNLIIQVLSLYTSAAEREAEIKNLSSVYGELKSEVLPSLRRVQMVNSSDVTGKSDFEMYSLVNSNSLSELTVEELLHLAALVIDECSEKVTVLEYAANQFGDARAYNNLAVVYSCMGEDAKALAAFEKAAQGDVPATVINNNLALANLSLNNVEEAKKYAGSANTQTKSAIAMASGDYSVSGIDGYNAAIAAFMREDYAAASSAIAKCTSADADYLRAAIAVRTGDLNQAQTQLNNAISKDASLEAKAKGDVNLQPLF